MANYDPNIPQPDDLISDSQSEILANFQQLNTQFGIDHQPLWDGSENGNGYHQWISFFKALTSPPALPNLFPPALVNPSIEYTQTVGTDAQLFFKNSTTIAQLTGLVPVTTTSGATGSGIITPWGLILNWGATVLGNSGTTKFQIPYTTFPTTFPVVLLTPLSSFATTAIVTTENNETFSWSNTPSASQVFFFAIGM
jgi:hypothetical protein